MYHHLLFSITSLLMLPASHGFSVHDTTVPGCPTFDCGDDPEIAYPFWVSEDEAAAPSTYCGYSSLKLLCRNETPVLRLAGGDYVLQSIDYAVQTIHVSDLDLLIGSGECPSGLHNFTSAAHYLFDYTAADSNLTFFLNCSDGPPGDGIECKESGGNRSFVFLEGDIPSEYDLAGDCGEIATVPVLRELVQNLNVSALRVLFDEIVRSGFQLSWVPAGGEGCPACEGSGGRCGYNQTSSGGWEFLCFCPDGPHDFRCNNSRAAGESKSNMIIIGVAAGGTGLLAACCLFLIICTRRGRKQRFSTSHLLRAISSPLSFKKDPELGSAYLTQNFSYKELEQATDRFSASNELGDGGFGTVYKGKLRDGRTVAVKRLYENNYKRVEQFMNEIAILSRLHHQNLVSLYGCSSRHSRELLLVYEFVPNGTLADHLHGSHAAADGALTWHVRMNIAIETADALAYLHAVKPQIIHRDIKTTNILLDNGFHVKVADFGLSRLFPADVTHVSTAPQGTPGYVDPEYHQCYQLTDKSDVYSFGVVLVELISSKPAVDVNRHRHEINLANMAINKIQNRELDELIDLRLGYKSDSDIESMINQTAELAFRCLQGDGDMRPPIKEVLEVLDGIKNGGNAAEKATDCNASTRYGTPLLKSGGPCSPDSVTDKWASRSTTPNTSG